MRIFGQNRRRPIADAFDGRRTYVEPVMDRELPMALFGAVLAAVVLVGIQVQSSSAAQKKEAAALRATHTAVLHKPDSRLASSQQNFADTFEQRVR